MTRIGDPYRPHDADQGSTWLVTAKCDACSWPSVAEYEIEHERTNTDSQRNEAKSAFDAREDDRRSQILWHPLDVLVKAVEDVPQGIDQAMGEAVATLAIGANKAAVLMSRAVIEATAKDHDIDKGTLASKIDALEEQRVITPSIKDAAHEIRHLGNDMAHGDFATTSVTPEEAAEVVEITEALLSEVYQRPAQIQRIKDRRLAKKPTP